MHGMATVFGRACRPIAKKPINWLMSQPLVTIITPTYNRAKLIVKTVESILRQDYPNIEYIVLDDGSRDNTQEVLEPFKDRLQYIYHDNMGETATVNKGFSLARGDIVCVINSDDPFYVDDAISTAVRYLNGNPDALMAYADWVSIDENDKVLHKESLPQYTLKNMIESARVSVGPGMFIRKSTIEKIGPRNSDLRYVGDLDYSFKMASEGDIVHIPHFLATHRVHSESLSSSAKGNDMAREVIGLGESYIDHPSLPEMIRKKRGKLMAKWYFITIYFVGSNFLAGMGYYLKALNSSAFETIKMSILFVLRKLFKSFFLKYRT